MQARQLLLLAMLLAGGAVLTAIVPKHPLLNAPSGTYVLATMSASAVIAALLVRWRAAAKSKSGLE